MQTSLAVNVIATLLAQLAFAHKKAQLQEPATVNLDMLVKNAIPVHRVIEGIPTANCVRVTQEVHWIMEVTVRVTAFVR